MYSLLRDTRSEYQYIPCSVMSLMLNRKHQGKVADVEVAAESVIGLFNMDRRHWILVFAEKLLQQEELLLPSQPNDIFQYRLGILESIAKNQAPLKNCVDTVDVKCLQVKKRVQWIGCDQCGDFWIHYQCMRTNDSYNAVSAS